MYSSFYLSPKSLSVVLQAVTVFTSKEVIPSVVVADNVFLFFFAGITKIKRDIVFAASLYL